jgi:hypothetical protein
VNWVAKMPGGGTSYKRFLLSVIYIENSQTLLGRMSVNGGCESPPQAVIHVSIRSSEFKEISFLSFALRDKEETVIVQLSNWWTTVNKKLTETLARL